MSTPPVGVVGAPLRCIAEAVEVSRFIDIPLSPHNSGTSVPSAATPTLHVGSLEHFEALDCQSCRRPLAPTHDAPASTHFRMCEPGEIAYRSSSCATQPAGCGSRADRRSGRPPCGRLGAFVAAPSRARRSARAWDRRRWLRPSSLAGSQAFLFTVVGVRIGRADGERSGPGAAASRQRHRRCRGHRSGR